MPRKRKTTQLSKTGCVTETSAASGRVLQSDKKQMTLLITKMSHEKKTPVAMSTSTPSKANAQQL